MLNLRQNTAERPKILVIDDEDIIRQLLMRSLGGKGYEVEVAEDAGVALEKIGKSFFNLLIIDLKMPKVNGIDVLKDIKKSNPYIEVIIITGYPDIESAVVAIKIGAFDYVCKPFDIHEMESIVERSLEKQKFAVSHIELSELATLFEISKTITATTSLDLLLELILDSALSVTKAKKGYVLLRDEATKKLTVKAVRGLTREAIDNKRIKFSEDIFKNSSFRDNPVLDNETFLRIPLVSKSLYSRGNILGAIGVAEKISREGFTERELTLLSVLSGEAVAAIENCRLYSQLNDKIETLKHTVKKLNETQNQLIQSEKLSAVGQLAFGIAHEIRNPLGIILGGTEFLENKLAGSRDKTIKQSIERVRQSINRADNIVTELLKFSKASRLQLQSVNICKILDEAVSFIKNRAYLNSIVIKKSYSQKDLQVNADPTMLQQVFFNLCNNAIDAMPKGGTLFLKAYCEKSAKKARKKMVIEITDTGSGIDKDKLSKIFEPFFTTKPPGEGTGLGLSIVHLILQRHRATIDVKSAIGRGSKFTIKLPIAGKM